LPINNTGARPHLVEEKFEKRTEGGQRVKKQGHHTLNPTKPGTKGKENLSKKRQKKTLKEKREMSRRWPFRQ